MRERKPMITHLLVSSLAAAALVGFWIADPLESTAETVSDVEVVQPQEMPPVAEVSVAMVSASTGIPVTHTKEIAAAEIALVAAPAPEVVLATVPDLGRLSVWEARKKLKKQGLRFAFKQGARRIHHEDFGLYRVRKQSLVAGQSVAAGTKVTVQVKEIKYASGY